MAACSGSSIVLLGNRVGWWSFDTRRFDDVALPPVLLLPSWILCSRMVDLVVDEYHRRLLLGAAGVFFVFCLLTVLLHASLLLVAGVLPFAPSEVVAVVPRSSSLIG